MSFEPAKLFSSPIPCKTPHAPPVPLPLFAPAYYHHGNTSRHDPTCLLLVCSTALHTQRNKPGVNSAKTAATTAQN